MTERMSHHNPKIIAGPCAAESREQVLSCAEALKKMGINNFRASAIKPRTTHPKDHTFFNGYGKESMSWLEQVSQMGLTVATEVMTPDDVSMVVSGICQKNQEANLILWLGSRNQNDQVQRQIASAINSDAPKSTIIMIKNQPWGDKKHWKGILSHVLSTGFPEEKIWFCHRGFHPYKVENPLGLRNIPDFEMAMRVKEETGRPMLFDPSHIAGSRENVFRIVGSAKQYDFDGYMVEVHPDPDQALTDSKQQLSIPEFANLLEIIRPNARC